MSQIKNDQKPVALYNCDKQELVGVFMTTQLAGKYLFPIGKTSQRVNRVAENLRTKRRIIKETIFDFPVAVRYANDLQVEMMQDKVFFIAPGYPRPTVSMKGFSSCSGSLTREATENKKRRDIEYYRQQEASRQLDF